MWKNLVTTAYNERRRFRAPCFPRFGPSAMPEDLARAASALKTTFPEELKALLTECNGVTEVMAIDGQPVETSWLIWTLEEIVRWQSEPGRADPGPPSSWLVFANAGADGIVFGYDRALSGDGIWAWYPNEQRGENVAPSLSSFLRGWITGKVTV